MSPGRATETLEVKRWIVEAYALPGSGLEATMYQNARELGNLELDWSRDGVEYRVTGSDVGGRFTVTRTDIWFVNRYPTFGHLLGCLGWGDPDLYRATWEPRAPPEGIEYSFDAFFQDEGAILSSDAHLAGVLVPDRPPRLGQELPVNGMAFVQPESLQDSVQAIDSGYPANAGFFPIPWPGTWDKLEYATVR